MCDEIPESDEKLFERACQNVDGKAFEVLVAKHQEDLIKQASKNLGDEDAMDCVQMVWMKASRYKKNEPIRCLAAFLSDLLITECANHFRKQNAGIRGRILSRECDDRVDAKPCPHPGPVRLAEEAERRQMLHACLESLEPDERELIQLRYFQRIELKDIAKLTGIPYHTVRRDIIKVFAKIKEEWERRFGGDQ